MSAAKAPLIYLFFLSGSKKGKIESADAQVVRIGRQPYCEIALDPHQDIPASGDHCHIIRETDGAYYVLDSGSTFGTFLNGNRIQGRAKVTTGDVIECGRDENGGREGPRMKFYLESDIRKCPVCAAPVYKRHFRCPDCRKKTCLRCIDFTFKVCKTCAVARETAARKAEEAGYEVIEDDSVEGKRPARVVLKGKDAERLKRKKDAAAASGKPTREMARAVPVPAKAAQDSGLGAPLCTICGEFVKGAHFTCPACQAKVCVSHRTGRVCAPCAGITEAPRASGSASEEGVVAELVAPAGRVPPTNAPQLVAPGTRDGTRAAPPRGPGGVAFSAPVPGAHARSLPDDSTQDGVKLPRGPRDPRDPSASGTATCARCRGRLGPGTFACRSCHRVLCAAHLAVDECCEDCYLAGLDKKAPRRERPPRPVPTTPPAPVDARADSPSTVGPTRFFDRDRFERSLVETPHPPPFSEPRGREDVRLPPVFDPSRPPTLAEIEAMDMMPLLDTERDEDSTASGHNVHDDETKKDFPIPVLDPSDDLAPRPRTAPSPQSPAGLTGLKFVCPHCDTPLAPNARACPRCRRAL